MRKWDCEDRVVCKTRNRLARRCFTLSTKNCGHVQFLVSWRLAKIVGQPCSQYTHAWSRRSRLVRDPCSTLPPAQEQMNGRRGSTIPKISADEESHIKRVSTIIEGLTMHTSSGSVGLNTGETLRLGRPFELAPRRRRFHPYKLEYRPRRSNSFRQSTSFESSRYNARRLNSLRRNKSDNSQYFARRLNSFDSSYDSPLAKMQNTTATLGRMNHANVISMEAKLETIYRLTDKASKDTSAGISIGPRDSRSMVEMTTALGGITLASELNTRYSSVTPVRSHVPSLASELGIKYSRPTSVNLERTTSRPASLSAGFMAGSLASELARCGSSTLAGELNTDFPRWSSPIDGFSPDQHSISPSPAASPRSVKQQAEAKSPRAHCPHGVVRGRASPSRMIQKSPHHRVNPASNVRLDTAIALMEFPPTLPSIGLTLTAFMASLEKFFLIARMVLPDRNTGPLDK
ncbi:hypothetical protein B0H13DRAFT_1919351 [Mycena leptocephala]|nr:hypothetical protein B0H13DRAFT_1919351 [Mycena leptocephala]